MDRLGFQNVRGMNKVSKQHDIRKYIQANNVGLFGLLETKIKGSNWIQAKNNICDQWMVCTNSSHHRGGKIWLIQDPKIVQVDIIETTAQCILAYVTDLVRQTKFWITLVYGWSYRLG